MAQSLSIRIQLVNLKNLIYFTYNKIESILATLIIEDSRQKVPCFNL